MSMKSVYRGCNPLTPLIVQVVLVALVKLVRVERFKGHYRRRDRKTVRGRKPGENICYGIVSVVYDREGVPKKSQ